MKLRSTHSLATLPISEAAYEEIKQKLLAAAYNHVFLVSGTGEMIDMHGIALVLEQESNVDGNNCIRCNRAMQVPNKMGQWICFGCAIKQFPEDEIKVDWELSRKDKNYHITETEVEF